MLRTRSSNPYGSKKQEPPKARGRPSPRNKQNRRPARLSDGDSVNGGSATGDKPTANQRAATESDPAAASRTTSPISNSAYHTPEPDSQFPDRPRKRVSINLDFGTRFTSGSITCEENGERNTYYLEPSFFNCTEHEGGAAFVPSTVFAPKGGGEPWRHGYNAAANSEGTIRWAKLLLISDDSSDIRRTLMRQLGSQGLSEDSVIQSYMNFIFNAFRYHLEARKLDIDTIDLHIRAALPPGSDATGESRLTEFLQSGASNARMNVNTSNIHIFDESIMAASCWIISSSRIPNAQVELHDTLVTLCDVGAGTINVQSLLISKLDASPNHPPLTLESIHCPHYFALGGDSWDRSWTEYYEKKFPSVNDVVAKETWQNLGERIKLNLAWDQDQKAMHFLQVLPDPIRNSDFQRDIGELFTNAYGPMVAYIREMHLAARIAYTKKYEREPRRHLLVYSGGQSKDPRMAQQLGAVMPSQESEVIKDPRLSVVNGLAAQDCEAFLPKYQTTFGFKGWRMVEGNDPGAKKNEELNVCQKETFIPLFHSGTTRILSHVRRQPCQITGPTEDISLPATHTMVQKLPNGTEKKIATLTIPRSLRKCGIEHRTYDEDDISGALDYYSIEYVVTVESTRRGLIFCILVILQDSKGPEERQVVRKEIEYGDLGISGFEDL